MHSPIEQGLNLDRSQVIFKLSYISIYVQPSKLRLTIYIGVSYNWPLVFDKSFVYTTLIISKLKSIGLLEKDWKEHKMHC
jgi:hypothetical protein